jgi:type IV pilus assembly protein PilM
MVTKGSHIKKWADCALEPGLVKDGVVVDEAEVAAKIVSFLQSQKVRARKVVVGLSGIHCFFRVLALPDVSGSLLANAVKLEAEKALPIPLDQLYISWQVLDRQGHEVRAFLAALPRSLVDTMVGAVWAAGLNPYLIDLKPLALSRAADRDTAIIADLQPTELNIVVMVGRVPELVRTLSLDKTRSWDERLALIGEELERTVKFFNSGHSKSPLDGEVPIIVSGELAEGLDLNKASDFKHPVLFIESSLKCPNEFPVGRYLVNIGLALKETGLPWRKGRVSGININALPVEHRPKPISWAVVLAVAGAIMAVGLLVPMVLLVRETVSSVSSLQVGLEAKQQFVAKRQKEVTEQRKEVQTLEASLNQLQASADKFKSLSLTFSLGQDTVNGDLAAIQDNMVAGVSIISISYSGDGVLVDGDSLSENEALTYSRHLRESGRFSDVIVTFIGIRQEHTGFRLKLSH